MVRACREKADKKIREILNDDQKKKLDQLEQEPHPKLHGNLNGATPPRGHRFEIHREPLRSSFLHRRAFLGANPTDEPITSPDRLPQ
jgi:hypothetical protein